MRYLRSFNESVNLSSIIKKIKKNLTPDLLKGIWKNDDPETELLKNSLIFVSIKWKTPMKKVKDFFGRNFVRGSSNTGPR